MNLEFTIADFQSKNASKKDELLSKKLFQVFSSSFLLLTEKSNRKRLPLLFMPRQPFPY